MDIADRRVWMHQVIPFRSYKQAPTPKREAKHSQEVVHALAKMGHHIVIDDVSFGKQQLDEWKKALEAFQVLWVGVNAPLPVLEQREKERGNRIQDQQEDNFIKYMLMPLMTWR